MWCKHEIDIVNKNNFRKVTVDNFRFVHTLYFKNYFRQKK